MAVVHYDVALGDDARREMLYAGDIFVYSPSDASLELCELARSMLRDAFAPLDPETAQHDMPVKDYAALLARLKPAFIHHPECKKLIPRILATLGCDRKRSYFDVPRLRTSTSDGYLTTGIAYAFHPHRDTWYSAAQCQLNWWLPVEPIAADNCMAFYPKYFARAVKNGSHTYNYARWNRESRADAAKHIGKDTRVQPKPQEPIDRGAALRLLPPVGSIIIFSAAQLHASVENTSGRTRFSIDFRTVNSHDLESGRGAANVDSECTGTSLGDFLRCSDLKRLPDSLVSTYDTPDPLGAPNLSPA